MLKLADIYLQSDLSDKLFDKLEQYNKAHPDDTITAQEFAVMLLEYGIRYLDISALD